MDNARNIVRQYPIHQLAVYRFLQIIILHVGCREFIRGIDNDLTYMLVFGTGVAVLAGISVFAYTKQILVVALSICAAYLIYKLVTVFPGSSNHFYVELLVTASSLLLLSRKIDEERSGIWKDYIMWLVVFVLAGSGVQKILAGTYLSTSFMAFKAINDPDFHDFFYRFGAQDVARLSMQSRAVPMEFENAMLKFMTISIPFAEILAGVLMLIPRTRMFGVFMGLATLIGIEYVAKELMFGSVFAFMMCYRFPDRIFTRLFIVFIAIYLLLIGLTLFRPSFVFN